MEWEPPNSTLLAKRAIAKRIAKQTLEELQPLLDKAVEARDKPLTFLSQDMVEKVIKSLEVRIKNIKDGE
jgi:hypothetical protein